MKSSMFRSRLFRIYEKRLLMTSFSECSRSVQSDNAVERTVVTTLDSRPRVEIALQVSIFPGETRCKLIEHCPRRIRQYRRRVDPGSYRSYGDDHELIKTTLGSEVATSGCEYVKCRQCFYTDRCSCYSYCACYWHCSCC